MEIIDEKCDVIVKLLVCLKDVFYNEIKIKY